MDAYLLLVAAALGGVVAVLVLRPGAPQALGPGVPALPALEQRDPNRRDALAQRARASRPRDDANDEDVGPYPRLATEIAELRHAFKLLQNEWSDKESRMDALIKRGHRLRKLEQLNEPAPPEAAPPMSAAEQRVAVLQKFRQQTGG